MPGAVTCASFTHVGWIIGVRRVGSGGKRTRLSTSSKTKPQPLNHANRRRYLQYHNSHKDDLLPPFLVWTVAHVGDDARCPVRDRLLHSSATSTWRYTEFSMSRDHSTLTSPAFIRTTILTQNQILYGKTCTTSFAIRQSQFC